MFNYLVDNFKSVIQKEFFGHAHLYVQGMATQVVVKYLPDNAMEIRGLPPDLASYLWLQRDIVSIDPYKEQLVINEEEAGFYRLYQCWDPRVISKAHPAEEKEPVGGRWKARYNIAKAISLHPAIEERIKRFIEHGREVEYLTDGVRLRELSQWDFSEYPTRLTLTFEYPDGK